MGLAGMRWLLDTNVWIDAMSGDAAAGQALLTAMADEWCGFSSMTRLEVLSHSGLSASDVVIWCELLAKAVEVPMSAAVVEEAARLRRTVRMKAPDAIIAATALPESATLVTRNTSDFVRVSGLRVSKP